jgi:hypothetical protein
MDLYKAVNTSSVYRMRFGRTGFHSYVQMQVKYIQEVKSTPHQAHQAPLTLTQPTSRYQLHHATLEIPGDDAVGVGGRV